MGEETSRWDVKGKVRGRRIWKRASVERKVEGDAW